MEIAIFQLSLFGINTYLLFDEDEKKCAVIDPGMSNPEEEKAIENFISEKGLTLTHIINTHLHIDHVAGVPFLKKKYGAPVLAHKGDEFMGQRLADQARMFGMNMNLDNIEISQYLEDGDIIKIGNGELEVISVPGHSKGSVALYDKKDGFLISGDALFQGSIGRTDLPGGNYSELITNINNRLLTLPDDTVVFPGHGPSTTIGREKRSNPFLA
ncbi:MAG: MBL fold metallo-hydrolase [Muribaculaceae bacterium]|nr:MBL fold metallo-hydrolase [Muribaculaceae bacterium]